MQQKLKRNNAPYTSAMNRFREVRRIDSNIYYYFVSNYYFFNLQRKAKVDAGELEEEDLIEVCLFFFFFLKVL